MKRSKVLVAIVALLFVTVGTASALTGGDATNLKAIKRKAVSIQSTAALLSPQVPEASKQVITGAAQEIIDEVNSLLTPTPTSPPPTTPPPTTPPPTSPPPPPGTGVHVAAAGDIANANTGDTQTSDLVIALDPDLVLTLGDNAYPDGTTANFNDFYDPTWGRFKSKTFPSPGNHEWHVADAAGYTTYFGTTTGVHERVVGDWLLVSIDSTNNIDASMNLLMSILENDDHLCELVFWHRPRWSSGALHGSSTAVQPLWQAAVDGGVDVVLNGHDHEYERFAQQGGVREFVVGTGGGSLYSFGTPLAASQVRYNGDWGVLDLNLLPAQYDWEFRAATGGSGTIIDSGSTICHP